MKVIIQIATDQHVGMPSQAYMRKVLKRTSELISKQHDCKNEVLLRIVSPAESQDLNQHYRHKDYPTNVLSFGFEASPGLDLSYLGDIIICHQVLKDEATAQHKKLLHHYTHLLIHGFLHLLGYDHMNDADRMKMEALEIKLLREFNIDNPYEDKT